MDKYDQEVVRPGDRLSEYARDKCFTSHDNCPAVIVVPHQPGNFRGAVGWVWQKHILEKLANYKVDSNGDVIEWEMLEEKENDTAGGKPQFSTLLASLDGFRGLCWEPIEMVLEDFTRSGRLPCVFANIIDAKYINEKNYYLAETMLDGFEEALRKTRQVNITGEVAIIKHMLTALCDTFSDDQLIVNWSASCVGLAHRDKDLDGSKIKPGMPIVGLGEDGYRCNGGTQHTNLIQARWGTDIKAIRENREAMEYVRKLTVPSVNYSNTITRVHGWLPDGNIREPMVKIAGMAHITGGGIEKFKELLPPGVGAELPDMIDPPEVLLEAQEMSYDFEHLGLKMSDKQCHTTFHGGPGMVVVCETEEDANILIQEAKKDGLKAERMGVTVESRDNTVKIQSKFKEKAEVKL